MALGLDPGVSPYAGTFPGPQFALVAADWQTPLAAVDTYETCTLIARHNEVSTFELTLPASTPAAAVFLTASRPRLLIRAGASGAVYRSGPMLRMERHADADGDVLTLSGVDDLVWLRRRLVHPQPASAAPPYSTSAYDARTGAASTVLAGYVDRNAGPSAVAARQVPGLTVPAPAAFGPTVTLSGRWQGLLEFVQTAALAAGIGFRVRDLTFEVFQPSGGAVFSGDLGTLAGWASAVEAPETNYVYVAGGGEGTARLIREYADVPGVTAWGRMESFSDRRDTTVVAEMDQAGAEALAEGKRPAGVEMETLDIASQRFLTDWNVGDTATVVIGERRFQDVIVEAQIELAPNAPPKVTPTLGASLVTLAEWRTLSANNRRLRQLERT